MIQQARDKVKKHIKTHSEHSVEDRAAISLLGTFLNPGGRINTSFAANDTWPNHDGTFEFISNPDVSRRPKQNFFVQIKGTSVYTEKDGIIKYSLKSLAFPAYICDNVSFDPGILFVVLDPDQRGSQRVFWKYMSVDFINSINFDQDMLGKLYLTGTEAPYDEERAIHWLTRSAEQGNQYAQYLLNHLEENRPPSAMLAVTRLLHHMSRIFRDNSVPKSRPGGIQIDRKRLKKLQEKRMALGHKPDDHEEQWPDMTM